MSRDDAHDCRRSHESGSSACSAHRQHSESGSATSRRRYLTALGVALGVAGCGGGSGENATSTVAPELEGTPSATETPDETASSGSSAESATETPSPTATPKPVTVSPDAVGRDVPGYPTVGHDPGRSGLVRGDEGPTTTEEGWQHATEGQVFSTPAIADGTVFASSQRGGVYAVEVETGRRRWRVDTEGGASSPTVVDGTVYVGGRDGVVRAVDAESGDVVWETETGGPVHSDPAVVDETVYVGSFDGGLYALSAADGSTEWRYVADNVLPGSPAVDDDGVYKRSKATASGSSENQRFSGSRESSILERLDPEGEADSISTQVRDPKHF